MRILLVATIGLLAACAPVRLTEIKADAGHRVPLPPPESAPAIDAVLRDNGIVTAGFGVMQDGELVWSHYYGEQSPGRNADADTRFNVASITKLIAAEAARPSKGTEVINASNPSAALVVAGQDVESTS